MIWWTVLAKRGNKSTLVVMASVMSNTLVMWCTAVLESAHDKESSALADGALQRTVEHSQQRLWG
jgi:hypothetical protein